MKVKLTFCTLLICLLIINCQNSGEEEQTEINPSVTIKKLTESKALQEVKTYVFTSKTKVDFRQFYFKSVRKKIPCDQYDIDLGRNCTGQSISAPMGYRWVFQNERTCCKTKKKAVSSIKGNWIVTYYEPNDEWKVELDFTDDEKTKNKLSWMINDKNKTIRENK